MAFKSRRATSPDANSSVLSDRLELSQERRSLSPSLSGRGRLIPAHTGQMSPQIQATLEQYDLCCPFTSSSDKHKHIGIIDSGAEPLSPSARAAAAQLGISSNLVSKVRFSSFVASYFRYFSLRFLPAFIRTCNPVRIFFVKSIMYIPMYMYIYAYVYTLPYMYKYIL